MDIIEISARFEVVNEERKELNREIKNHYTPLLSKAGIAKDYDEFSRLMGLLPQGCPFYNSVMRMERMYFPFESLI